MAEVETSVPPHILAFGLELLFGYMGFLGIGWLYGRRWLIGGLLLVTWLPFLLVALWGIANVGRGFGYPLSTICGALLLFPIYVGIPLLSAYGIRRRMEPKQPTPDAPGQDAVA